MILRRVIEHVRAQNWTAIAIDLVIVVVGVFIGIQVANWNETRLEQARALAYREQLAADLDDLQRFFGVRIEYYDDARRFGERAVRALTNEEELNPEQSWGLVLSLFQAGQYWPLNIASSSYDEAKGTGLIRSIADDDLRKDLWTFFELTAKNIDLVDNAPPRYRAFIRRRIPWTLLGPRMWTECQTYSSTENLYQQLKLTDCAPPQDVSPGLLMFVARNLKNDPQVAEELSGRMTELEVIGSDYRNYQQRAARLAELLERKR